MDEVVHTTPGGLENSSFETLEQATVWLWRVCPPLILVLGTFGNVMTIVVLRRMNARQSAVSMSVYLHALAVSDLVLLYTGLPFILLLHGFWIDIASLHDILCKVPIFLAYFSGMTSSLLLASVTFERMISVMWPHRANLVCTRARNIVVVLAIVFFCVAVNSYMLVTSKVVTRFNGTQKVCSYNEQHLVLFAFWRWVGLAFTSLIPFCVLVVANTVIIRKVTQFARAARNLTNQASSRATDRERSASSMTVTLVLVSVAFLLLTLPVCILSVYYFAFLGESDHYGGTKLVRFIWAICSLLFYCNAAVNFYLYCLSGSKFRKEFKRLFSVGTENNAQRHN